MSIVHAVGSKLLKIMPHNDISQGGAQKPANKASNTSGWGFRECCSQGKNCNKTRSKHNPWFVFLHCKRSPVQVVSSSEQFWSVCTKELFTVCAVTSTEERSKFLLHGQQEFIFSFLFFSLGKKKIFFFLKKKTKTNQNKNQTKNYIGFDNNKVQANTFLKHLFPLQ